MKFCKIALIVLSIFALTELSAADQFWKKRTSKKRMPQPIELPDTTAQVAPLNSVEIELDTLPSNTLTIDSPSTPKPAVNDSITLKYSISQIDSLLGEWQQRSANEAFEEFREYYINADNFDLSSNIPDSIYIKRLEMLVSPVILPFNHITKSYIERYTNTRYGTINRILSLSQYYFPHIEEQLMLSDIPVEFRAMPIIESALSATAVSRAGAAGLWQFMPATGKSYGLEINSLVDERLDPQRSTKAACEFINDLYRIYGDWTLVIAAYNCGPGNVNKALARSGVDKSSGTFWDIYAHLPRETRGYVPAFIGASYAYAYHQQHNIEFDPSPLPLATDTLHIDRIMHLGQVSEVLEIPIETLRALNPQYRKDIIPATTKSYTLRLPQQYITAYITNEELIASKDSTYLKEFINPEAVKKAMTVPSFTVHRVKSGETLGAIARKYRVTTKQIIKWNNLRNPDRLSVGQSLKIETK